MLELLHGSIYVANIYFLHIFPSDYIDYVQKLFKIQILAYLNNELQVLSMHTHAHKENCNIETVVSMQKFTQFLVVLKCFATNFFLKRD